MRAVPLVLALLAVAPFAAAQLPVPVPNACGPLALAAEPTPPPDTLAPNEPAEVSLVIQNGGSIPARVTASASISEAGWAVAAPAPAVVAAGGEGTFTFTITPDATATEDARVAFVASGACETALGNACGDACNAGSVNAQTVLRLAPDEGFRIPGLDALGSFGLEYLIAGIVLVGLASAIPFALRKKKGGLSADCPEPLKLLKPGRGTSFPVEIRNTGRDATSATFEIGAVPEGWSAFMPLPEVQLAPREARSLWLMVRAPANAVVGETVDIEVRLRDVRGGNGALVKVRAEVAADAA